MENLHLSVIPAKAGIPKHLKPLDPCLRRDDGQKAFFDTLLWGKGQRLSLQRGMRGSFGAPSPFRGLSLL